jgi:acyl-CoA thioesterase
VDLPQSDAVFVKAYPAETAKAFCGGYVAALAFLGWFNLASRNRTPTSKNKSE